MNFSDVERRYAELKAQFDAGGLSEADFDAALKDLMIQDSMNRWWALTRDTGEWNYYDQAMGEWVQATPPSAGPPPPPLQPTQPYQPAQPSAPAQPGGMTPGLGPAPVEGPLSQTVSIVLYVVSFLIPIAGIVIWFLYRNKPYESDQKMARLCLILGVVSFLLSCICSFTFMGLAGSGY